MLLEVSFQRDLWLDGPRDGFVSQVMGSYLTELNFLMILQYTLHLIGTTVS